VSLVTLSGVVVRSGGRERLRVVELHLTEGEVLAVLGPTGAGKSTLLQVIHLLLRPEQGTISWRGQPVSFPAPLELRRRMAMAFQDPHLFSGSVAENVAYGLRVRGLRGEEVHRRVDETLEELHVASLARRSVDALSGGEAQRVALARALVLRPELLLLDEPLASLDEPIREELLAEIEQIVRSHGITCVVVTHDQAEALAVADRVAVLDRGALLQVGVPEDVYYRPGTRRVAEFVRTGNILEGVVVANVEGLARVAVGALVLEAVHPAVAGTQVLVCLRPEEVVLAGPGEPAPSSARNRMSGVVTGVTTDGPVVRVAVACGCTLTALVTRPSATELGLEAGVRVSLSFKATAVHLLPELEV
jgi:tungstate transport system ATP-binding protein